MSDTQAPADKDSPLMVAWEAYKATPEYQNTRHWALDDHHTDGSLWAAFEQGFRAAALRAVPQAPQPQTERDRLCYLVERGRPAEWWTGRGDEWTTSPYWASHWADPIRFARREDAERAIGWLLPENRRAGVFVTEHIYVAAAPVSPAPQLENIDARTGPDSDCGDRLSADAPTADAPVEATRVLESICISCDGCGWCEGSPAFTCPKCKGAGVLVRAGGAPSEEAKA